MCDDYISNARGYVICNESGREYETTIPVNIAPIEIKKKELSDKIE